MAPFGRQWFSLQDRSAGTIIKLAENNAPKVQKQIELKQKELGWEMSTAEVQTPAQKEGRLVGLVLHLLEFLH